MLTQIDLLVVGSEREREGSGVRGWGIKAEGLGDYRCLSVFYLVHADQTDRDVIGYSSGIYIRSQVTS